MAGKLNVYKFGQSGVNLVKDPLHLSDDEVTQAQNAEIQSDVNTGGDGALSKRGGLSTLTGSALSGSILGIFGIPILTTYLRTLYLSRGSQNSSTFTTTTDGTSLNTTTTPLAMAIQSDWTDENGSRDAHRIASFKNLIVYPGNNYTKSTDNPEISVWDATTAQLVQRIPIGPSGNGSPAYAITDMLTANGKIYFAVHDPGGSGANLDGRVMQYDPVTGQILQVLNPFGSGTGEMTGGYPSALAWYQGMLFVGLNGSATTDGIGKVVRAIPDVDTVWTSDVSNLVSHVSSLVVFNGDLYVGTQASVSTAMKIYKRTATTAAYTVVYTGAGVAANGFMGNLIVSNSIIYASEYHTTAPTILIKKSVDGTSWTTDRDVAVTDGAVAGNLPTASILFNGDVYFSFRATTVSATDGIIDKLHSGSWSKLSTANYNGPMAVLVTRS